MFKVLSVFGTRPEAIKMAPVVRALEARDAICSRVCVTAQHRQMLDRVLEVFHITSDYDLDIMRSGQSLSDVSCAALRGIENVLREEKPEFVLVHGDTSTAFAAALAAFYQRLPVGHVEAGLRSRNKYSPWPEEMNRQLVDRLSDLYFAPTETSRDNLLAEGVDREKIFVTGNTVIDALSATVSPSYSHPELERLEKGERLILLTAHRRENWGEPLRRIFRAARRAAEEIPKVRVICPVHPNPAVRRSAEEVFGGCERVRLIEPLDVLDFHNFIARADLILTDSGGIQEEAPALGKPVLVLRDTTERPEGVLAGTLRLVGTDEENILRETRRLLTDQEEYLRMSRAVNPYGDGHAAERIADALCTFFSLPQGPKGGPLPFQKNVKYSPIPCCLPRGDVI